MFLHDDYGSYFHAQMHLLFILSMCVEKSILQTKNDRIMNEYNTYYRRNFYGKESRKRTQVFPMTRKGSLSIS